jgi:adhesin transport system outer membrane protein
LKRLFNFTLFVGLFFSSSLLALTLKESVNEVLDTNPVVKERLKNFRATQQDLNIAESEYYPQLDLRASAGYNDAGELYDHVRDIEYTNYRSSLIFTQNIFNGFGSMHKVDYEESRILAAAYNYIEKANDIAFKMSMAYLEVMKSYEMLQTAKENVSSNENIYAKVQDLFDAGLTTESEVKKIQSSLSLARSNYVVQQNNTHDKEYTFRRILGRMPDIAQMQKPELNVKLPSTIERAALYAIEHNPSLLVSRYNIKGAQALYKQRKKDFYPKVDLEISQTYNDAHDIPNGFDQADDRFKARVVLSYNLFRGGADRANIQKHISKINQEIEIKRDLKRQVVEGLDLSWDAYKMIDLQLYNLREYNKYSEKTLELYKEEYDLGRRSLLDLLSAQNDAINSRAQIIKSEYDKLAAKYRILDAMGLLVLAVTGDTDEFTSKVNLYGSHESKEILDEIPVKLDADNDNISDSIDLCDNSLKGNNIMPYGCKKIHRDSDGDGIIDSLDKCLTPKGVEVAPDGCAYDRDMDGVMDYKDKCLKTPIGFNVDENGCISSVGFKVYFLHYKADIPSESKENLKSLANLLSKSKEYSAVIVGHASNEGPPRLNMELSMKRARAVRNFLISSGVNRSKLKIKGMGEEEPVASSLTPEGIQKNRRVEIELIKSDEGNL